MSRMTVGARSVRIRSLQEALDAGYTVYIHQVIAVF